MTHSISLELSGTPKQCARRSVLAMISVLAALIFGWAATARADDHDDGVVRIMTQNVYEGTNFTELLAAATPPLFFAAVTTTRQNILATKPAVRAAAVAREIARELPDLVALQEAAILGSALVPVSTSAPPTPVTTVEEDQLALVLAELERLGHPYHAIAILPNLDAQAPSSLGPSVRITVRAAILVRSDRNDIRLSNTQVREFLDLSAWQPRSASRFRTCAAGLPST